MKNPVVIYALLRLGTFAIVLSALLLLQFNGYFAALVAAALTLSISLLFFTKQRNEASTYIYENRNKQKDSDAKLEDSKLDGDDR